MKKEDANNKDGNINYYLKNAFESLGKTQSEVIKDLGKSQPYVSSLMKGKKTVGKEVAKQLEEMYGFDAGAILTGKDEAFKNPAIPKGELKPKTYSHTLEVRLVSNKAKTGWSEGFYNDEYLEKMPVITIEADANYRGEYMAFEVAGDSMEPDYMEGDIVICRKIQRHLWMEKLHIRDWDFVIAHGTQGIMLKEIAEHNVETGEILCRSINSNYKDFTLNLREVTYLYNVVEVRQKGRNKRWNRAKDFL